MVLLNFAAFAFLRYICAANCSIVLVLVFWIIYFVEEKKSQGFYVYIILCVSHVLTMSNPDIFTQKQKLDSILSDMKFNLIVITVLVILPSLLQIKICES